MNTTHETNQIDHGMINRNLAAYVAGNSKFAALPRDTVCRVVACAILANEKNPQKIADIAEKTGTNIEQASVRYVLGAIKKTKAIQGVNFTTALELLEDQQVAKRQYKLSNASVIHNGNGHGQSNISVDMDVKRINKVNNADYAYLSSVDNGKTWAPMIRVVSEKKETSYNRVMGKVYGELYNDITTKQVESDPAVQYLRRECDHTVVTNLTRYLQEYKANLSPTCNNAINALIASKEKTSYIFSAAAKKDKPVYKIAQAFGRIYRAWEHKAAVTLQEFADLLRRVF